MNNILYEKWRPKKFKDVIGQDIIINLIKNSFILNKIHHSYILIGSRGVGKTTVARLIVKSLNCLNKLELNNNNFPCCNCDNCISIENNNFFDFIELDAAIKSSVEDIKELIDNTKYLPIKSKYKIYIIDEVHVLSKQGFSSLLKILEEPPSYIKIILATTEIKKIPDTILSRCIILNFNEISEKNIVNKLSFILKNENIDFDINSLYLISNFSKGSIRDALNILEKSIILSNNEKISLDLINKIIGICNIDFLINIILSILNNNNKIFTFYINKLNSNIINYDNLLNQLINLVHNIIMINLNKNYIINPFLKKFYNDIINISNNYKIFYIKKIYEIILEERKNFFIYMNQKIGFEICLLKLFININNFK